MFCAVYKSLKKSDTYLYIKKKSDFSNIPQHLLDLLGKLELVMVVPVRPAKNFARVNLAQLESALEAQSYYLQLPPPVVNYLEEDKQARLNEADEEQ